MRGTHVASWRTTFIPLPPLPAWRERGDDIEVSPVQAVSVIFGGADPPQMCITGRATGATAALAVVADRPAVTALIVAGEAFLAAEHADLVPANWNATASAADFIGAARCLDAVSAVVAVISQVKATVGAAPFKAGAAIGIIIFYVILMVPVDAELIRRLALLANPPAVARPRLWRGN